MTDPINNIDASSLSEPDRVEIERLRAAYARGGATAVAEGIADLATNRPDLFDWLLRKLAE